MKFKSKIKSEKKFQQAVDAGLAEKSKEAAVAYQKILRRNAPKKRGYLRKNITVKSRKSRGVNAYRLTVEMPEYGIAQDRGIDKSDGIIITPKNSNWLKFHWRRWKNRPSSDIRYFPNAPGFYKNGFYFFKRVRLHIPAQPFIEKSMEELFRTKEMTDFSKFWEIVVRAMVEE